MLFGAGIAGALGLVLAGAVFGRRTDARPARSPSARVPSLVGVGVPGQPVPALLAFIVWGLAFGMLPPLLQTRLLHAASARSGTPPARSTRRRSTSASAGGRCSAPCSYDSLGLAALPWVYAGIVVAPS